MACPPPAPRACPRQWQRLAIHLCLIAVITMLASCIDGYEEYWLTATGHGRADIRYQLPTRAIQLQGGPDAIRHQILDRLNQSGAFSSSSCDIQPQPNRTTLIHIQASFDSAFDLQKLAQAPSISSLPGPAHALIGDIQTHLSSRNVDFTRTVTPSQAIPGSAFMPASTFAGNTLTTIIHLPFAASQSNATTTSDDGRTLTWQTPLASALKSPVVTHFTMPIPIPWTTLCAVGLPILLLAGFTVSRTKRKRDLSSPPTATTDC